MWILRKILSSMEDVQAMEFLLDRLKSNKTNKDFFEAMRRG
jgi:transcription termination factor Rho